MNLNTFLILFGILPALYYAQLLFPEDDDDGGGFSRISSDHKQHIIPPSNTIPANLSELRGTPQYDQYLKKIISTGILKLTLAVDRTLSRKPEHQNDKSIVYSPVSIAAALALVLLGSSGRTFDEIANVMGLAAGVDIHGRSHIVHEQFALLLDHLQSTTSGTISLATAIFVQEQYPIRKEYRETATNVYRSEVYNVNFHHSPNEAQRVMNSWVSRHTAGKIGELFSEAPSTATKVILASTMYFKNLWEKPFFDNNTKKRLFYPNGRRSGSNLYVDMMMNGGLFPYYRDRRLDCEILGFPYKGNQTTMYVILPYDSSAEKLRSLEHRLDDTELYRLVSNVRYTDSVVVFPRMTIDSTLDLRQSLRQLGVNTLFSPGEANLARLSPGIGTTPHFTSTTKETSNNRDGFIFSRSGPLTNNCTRIFDSSSDVLTCEDRLIDRLQRVVYKRFGSKLGRRVVEKKRKRRQMSFSGSVRKENEGNLSNPGIYVDSVIHKVFINITESGTEAAAGTAISLSRSGGRVNFRVDVPFFFFIMHEQTKTILFWGSVAKPTPHYQSPTDY